MLDESEAKLLRTRVLERTLEAFYEELDPGREQLADTLGAGRDDTALAELVLELYDKLQSHADPEKWLRENRAAWSELTGSFDETAYAGNCWRACAGRRDTGRGCCAVPPPGRRETRPSPGATAKSS